MFHFQQYREIWAVDFEFATDRNLHPAPVCLVARELKSGREVRLWRDEFGKAPPYGTGPDSLFVAYYAIAEISCHLSLDWPVPQRILDLFCEFKCLTNGLPRAAGAGLLGALTHYGLDAMGAGEKQEMRDLVLGGGPWTSAQRSAILDYCAEDVAGLARLLPAMQASIDLPRALLRGRYTAAVARMERNGVPIDLETLSALRRHWDDIRRHLIAAIDKDFGVYDGSTFKTERFAALLEREQIAWPRLASGRLDLSDDTFRQMARAAPRIALLHELRSTLARLRLNDLAVGEDGCNRTMLSAFRSKTGRNQPSNSRFIFGPSAWIRSLIKPPQGHGVAYIDWKQQEFGIAAALSGDVRMQEAYSSGDPYLAFAKPAGAVPADATKASHKQQREQFKHCVLGVQYAMGADSLAQRIGQPPIVARELLRLHRSTYHTFWAWSDALLDQTMLAGELATVFGGTIRVGRDANPRSLRNFPMQANGAEMLRLACCKATEEGIAVSAPVHDAVLITAPIDMLEEHVAGMQAIMAEASRIVLGGFELGTDAVIVRHPERYQDERGAVMWRRAMDIVAHLEAERASRPEHDPQQTPRTGGARDATAPLSSLYI
jgi:hypothetical protein